MSLKMQNVIEYLDRVRTATRGEEFEGDLRESVNDLVGFTENLTSSNPDITAPFYDEDENLLPGPAKELHGLIQAVLAKDNEKQLGMLHADAILAPLAAMIKPASDPVQRGIVAKVAAVPRSVADLATYATYKGTTVSANFLLNAGCFMLGQIPAELGKDALLVVAIPFKALANLAIRGKNWKQEGQKDAVETERFNYGIYGTKSSIFSKHGWRPSTGVRGVVGAEDGNRRAKVLDGLGKVVNGAYTVAFQIFIAFPTLTATNALRLVATPITGIAYYRFGADVGGLSLRQNIGADMKSLFCRSDETLADRFAGSHEAKTVALTA